MCPMPKKENLCDLREKYKNGLLEGEPHRAFCLHMTNCPSCHNAVEVFMATQRENGLPIPFLHEDY